MRRAPIFGRGTQRAVLAVLAMLCAGGAVGGPPPAGEAVQPRIDARLEQRFCRTTPDIERRVLARHADRALAPSAPRLFQASEALAPPGVQNLLDTGRLEEGSIVDMGGVVVLVDDGSGVFGSPFNSSGLRLDTVQLAKLFYTGRPDDVETLAFFPNFDHGDGTFHTLVKSNVENINRGVRDDTVLYGSSGFLESVLVLANFNRRPDDPAARLPTDHNTHLSIVAHEWAHRFGAFVRFNDDGLLSTALLGRQLSHWCFFADTRAAHLPGRMSALEGNLWVQDIGGLWRTNGATDGYSPLDLYLMGFMAPEDVPPMFYLEVPPSSVTCSSSPVSVPPQTPVFSSGIRRDVTIDDIMLAEGGERIPDHTQAKRDYRMAFVLVARRGRFPSPAEVAKLDRLRTEWEPYFGAATGGQATIDTSTGAVAGAATTFAVVRLPGGIQAGIPFRFAIMALDTNGRVATDYQGTVHFTSDNDPGATLAGDLTFTAADRGYVEVADPSEFSIGGSQSLTLTDVNDATITGTRTRIPVEPPRLNFCAPGDPDTSDTTSRPWGLGSAFAGAGGVRFQYLIHRDTIGRPGLITGLNWTTGASPDRMDWDGIDVRLAHKPDFHLLSSGAVDPMTQNTLDSLDVTPVLTGRVSLAGIPDAGRLHFVLDQFFPYNGIDHLLIELRYRGGVPTGLETDKVLAGPDFLLVEKLGPNFPVPRVETSTICLDVRLPTGVVPTVADLNVGVVHNTGATVSWRTSPSTDGRVIFGEAGGTLDQTTELDRFDVVHDVEINGLAPGTAYEAMVESRDIDNQVVQGGPVSFTTTAFEPSIAALTPSTLPQGTPNTLVRIFGENFFDGLDAQIVEAALPPSGPPVPDATARVVAMNRRNAFTLDLGVVIDADAPPGPRRIYVQNIDGFSVVSTQFFGVEPPSTASDMDGSGRTDGFDLARLSRAFGARFPNPRYDIGADLDGDGDNDGVDLTRLADRFGD